MPWCNYPKCSPHFCRHTSTASLSQEERMERNEAESCLVTLPWWQNYCKAPGIAGGEWWHPYWHYHRKGWHAQSWLGPSWSKILPTSADLRPNRDIGSRRSRVFTERLLVHGVGCGWRNNDWFGCQEWDLRRYDAGLNSSQKWLRILSAANQNRSYPILFSHKRENKSS